MKLRCHGLRFDLMANLKYLFTIVFYILLNFIKTIVLLDIVYSFDKCVCESTFARPCSPKQYQYIFLFQIVKRLFILDNSFFHFIEFLVNLFIAIQNIFIMHYFTNIIFFEVISNIDVLILFFTWLGHLYLVFFLSI